MVIRLLEVTRLKMFGRQWPKSKTAKIANLLKIALVRRNEFLKNDFLCPTKNKKQSALVLENDVALLSRTAIFSQFLPA